MGAEELGYRRNYGRAIVSVQIMDGEMAEWSNAAVLKTVEGNPLPGFESLSLRQNELIAYAQVT